MRRLPLGRNQESVQEGEIVSTETEKKKSNQRRLAIYRCREFNCNKSVERWQCCYFCEATKRCKVKCQNDPKRCQRVYLDSSVKHLIDDYVKAKKKVREDHEV